MNPPIGIVRHVSRVRAQRLVALGRLLVSMCATLAAAVGVVQRGDSATTLVVLGAWALLAAVVMWRRDRRDDAQALWIVAAIDVVVIAAVVLTTGGIVSPFFPMLVLPPYTASLLYGRKAMAVTIGCGLVLYVAALLVTREATDSRMVIMRLAIVLLLAIAVVRRADHDARIHDDLEHLATWPRGVAGDRDESVRELLRHAALTLRAPRAALVWRDADGSGYFARFGDTFEIEDDDSGEVAAPELGDASSFVDDGGRETGSFLAPDLRARLGSDLVLGARFASAAATGWLFLLDRRAVGADDIMLAEVVARLVSAGLEQLILTEMIRDGAAANERLRLSRDLHDGLLQSLSGLALHAQVARRGVSGEAAQHLGLIVEQLTDSQRTLRDFVEELRPDLPRRREPLALRLRLLAESIARQWDVPVSLSTDGDLDAANAGDVAAIVAEALTNAAKHAGASRIEATVRADDAGIRVDVVDDGGGFPFHGRFELPQLIAEQRGPWSLKERVASLGGELAIDSSSGGSRVEVRLPRAS